MKLFNGRIIARAERWPWQIRKSAALLSSASEAVGTRYGWRGTDGMGRFGGGWNWCLGFRSGGFTKWGITLHLDLLFGTVNLRYRTAYGRQVDEENEAARAKRKTEADAAALANLKAKENEELRRMRRTFGPVPTAGDTGKADDGIPF